MRKLRTWGLALSMVALAAVPAQARDTVRTVSGVQNCTLSTVALPQVCHLEVSHRVQVVSGECSSTSCKFRHSCSAFTSGTLVTGSMSCNGLTSSCNGPCSTFHDVTVVGNGNCAAFTVSGTAKSAAWPFAASWSHTMFGCIDGAGGYIP